MAPPERIYPIAAAKMMAITPNAASADVAFSSPLYMAVTSFPTYTVCIGMGGLDTVCEIIITFV